MYKITELLTFAEVLVEGVDKYDPSSNIANRSIIARVIVLSNQKNITAIATQKKIALSVL